MKRLVVKLGTNTLCDGDGLPDQDLINTLADEFHHLRSNGHQVLVISSGAIGFGRAALRLPETPLDIPMRQACAAVGQHRLMAAWEKGMARHKTQVAQLLVTSETFQVRRRYVHLHDCLETLLRQGVVPILNENDAVSVEEIDAAFTDNDRLGALIAAKVEADQYVILSDVEGLYDRPPHEDDAKFIDKVDAIDDAVLAMTGKAGKRGRGGMRSKLESAKQLMDAGVPVVIGYGRHEEPVRRLLDGSGTHFPAVGRHDGVRRWLQAARGEGTIHVDAGAAAALREGKHLLPAGITGVDGEFGVESVVDIACDGHVAKAVSTLSSRDLQRCLGMQSQEAAALLGINGSVNVTRKGRILID